MREVLFPAGSGLNCFVEKNVEREKNGIRFLYIDVKLDKEGMGAGGEGE